MDRRTFLRVSGAAGVTAAVAGTACARGVSLGASAPAPSGARGAQGDPFMLSQVGVQLYSVRKLMQQDAERALGEVRAAGYQLVETAGIPAGLSASAFRAMLDRAGLRTSSGHYPLEQFEQNDAAVIASAGTLGQEFVVLPFLPPAMRGSRDAYVALADRMNAFGEHARAAGVRFAYHNHDFEFAMFGGATTALETLIERTDPKLVSFELDAYWAYKAGHDPVRLFERFPGRFALCHLKDGTGAPERRIADVGAGVIDFRRLLSLAGTAGLRYGFVEHDEPVDAIASIRASHDHLRRLLTGG